MERIDIFDIEGNYKGYSKERHEELLEDEYVLVVHLWIKNKENKYLVQQRSKYKEVDPLLWSITSGFVDSGESSIDAVNRELKEELKLSVDSSDIKHIAHLKPINNKRFIVDIYMVNDGIDESTLKLQKEEVEQIKYWSREEILDKVSKNEFFNFNSMYENYFDYIF